MKPRRQEPAVIKKVVELKFLVPRNCAIIGEGKHGTVPPLRSVLVQAIYLSTHLCPSSVLQVFPFGAVVERKGRTDLGPGKPCVLGFGDFGLVRCRLRSTTPRPGFVRRAFKFSQRCVFRGRAFVLYFGFDNSALPLPPFESGCGVRSSRMAVGRPTAPPLIPDFFLAGSFFFSRSHLLPFLQRLLFCCRGAAPLFFSLILLVSVCFVICSGGL